MGERYSIVVSLAGRVGGRWELILWGSRDGLGVEGGDRWSSYIGGGQRVREYFM